MVYQTEQEVFETISYKLNSNLGQNLNSLEFLNKDEASLVLIEDSEFFDSLSQSDIKIRSNYLNIKKFYIDQTVSWTNHNIDYLSNIFEIINWKMNAFKFKYPDVVRVIKTTGIEEGYAAYCRSNAVILNDEKMRIGRYNLERLLTHELFHLYSQNHPDKRKQLFELIGFHECPKIQYPDDIKDFIITNPDTYKYSCYIEIDDQKYMPILFSKKDSEDKDRRYRFSRPEWGGDYYREKQTLFDYMQFGLLQGDLIKSNFKPILENGKSIIKSVMLGRSPNIETNFKNSYFDKIGRNTNYYIHPEENLADNFALLINNEDDYVQTPELLSKMREILSR